MKHSQGERAVSEEPLRESIERAYWRPFARISFRFSFSYIVLYYAPFVLGVIPGLGTPLAAYEKLWNIFDATVGTLLFKIDPARLAPHPTGSGDTTLAYIHQATTLAIALVIGVIWTLIDKRRPHYIGLHGWLRVLARYALAFALCVYALSKIVPSQFGSLGALQLGKQLGELSPMSLLWNFMAFSPSYTVFGGLAEMVPGIFLAFRRTALLGALIAFAVLLNVVMLNFCYDVPVKLYSLNLLLLSAFLIIPRAQRLFKIFVLNHAVPCDNLREPCIGKKWQRSTALGLKIAVLMVFLCQTVYHSIENYVENAATPPPTRLTTRGFHWVQEYPYSR
jgi:hypothetical protein